MSNLIPEKVLALLNDGDLDALRAYCTNAIHEDAAKVRGGNIALKQYKAAMKYIKAITKEAPHNLSLHGTWFMDDIQMLCNGYTAFMFDPGHHIDGLPLVDATVKSPDIRQFFGQSKEHTPATYTRAEVVAALKLHKASATGEKRCFIQVGMCWYNAQYLLDALDILGVEHLTLQQIGELQAAICVTDNAWAVILPIRNHN